MGNATTYFSHDSNITISVFTGDRNGEFPDTNVWMVLYDIDGRKTDNIKLQGLLKKGKHTSKFMPFNVPGVDALGELQKITFWRPNGDRKDTWFLERVEVENKKIHGVKFVVPVMRWIQPGIQYTYYVNDCFLPQDDPQMQQRVVELEERKMRYEYAENKMNNPQICIGIPADEMFSERNYVDFTYLRARFISQLQFLKMSEEMWSSFDEMNELYTPNTRMIPPESMSYWMQDKWFGLQRLQGACPTLIQHCKTIPESLGLTSDMVEPFLEGMKLEHALAKNKIFMVDLTILEDITVKTNCTVCSPIALFYLNKTDELLPIAIKLFGKRRFAPIFVPNNPPYTWLVAKMFYNNTEAQVQHAWFHFGLPHIVMEGVYIAMNRNLSPSHPVFKLLAPHFRSHITTNYQGLHRHMHAASWMNKCTSLGVDGMKELVTKMFKRWLMNVDGSIPLELESRGVLDPEVLPYYPYRDDAVDFFRIIHGYVSKVISAYYTNENPEKVLNDREIQAWRREMIKLQEDGGLGIQSVPGHLSGFTQKTQIIDTVATIISCCTVSHTISCLPFYDVSGFVPNYPLVLRDDPPTSNAIQLQESHVVKHLPTKDTTLDIMVISKIFSLQPATVLGDFQTQYFFDPPSVVAIEQFRHDLKALSVEIDMRNKLRRFKYEYANPRNVPNHIIT